MSNKENFVDLNKIMEERKFTIFNSAVLAVITVSIRIIGLLPFHRLLVLSQEFQMEFTEKLQHFFEFLGLWQNGCSEVICVWSLAET